MMKPSEMTSLVGVIDPDAYAAATYLSAAIDMSDRDQLLAVIQVGAMAGTATVDAKFTQAVTSGGTYKDVTLGSITQLTQASPDDSDQQVLLNLKQSSLDVNNGYRYVKLSVTIASAAVDLAAVVLGYQANYGPSSDNNLASVAEVADCGS